MSEIPIVNENIRFVASIDPDLVFDSWNAHRYLPDYAAAKRLMQAGGECGQVACYTCVRIVANGGERMCDNYQTLLKEQPVEI